MTDEEINSRFAHMAEAVARLAESSDARIQELRENDRLLSEKMDRLVDGYLALQQNLGTTSELLRQVIRENQQWRAEQEERKAEQERINEEFRQKNAESDQRFNILLEEIRFLIRQQNRDVD